MNKKRGSILLIVLFIILVVLTSILVYFYRQKNYPQENNYGTDQFVKGEILVAFNDGITYKEAKDYIISLGYDVEGKNIYWNDSNFKPNDSTLLKNIDVFKISVPVGRENEVIQQFSNSHLVRYAEKNRIIRIPDCSKGPC